ncbi:hypothetical protein [Paraburkholderia sp. GAS82]|uniref:hypothetical protein n=1 Tax=Paraburkholderia sp. GAS82 TaxID=3035137 RepID=UPI003D218C12
MDPISTLNQVMLLLRQQLAEKSRRSQTASSSQQTSPSSAARSAPQRTETDSGRDAIRAQVDPLRAAGIADDRQLFRSAVEGLLLREFGTEVGNDATFHQMGDWVSKCLEEEPHTRKMLLKLIEG